MEDNRSREDFDNNLDELGGTVFLGLEDYSSALPKLFLNDLSSSDSINSIKYSILILWHETVYAYGHGLSQISIMGCRAITEKILRVVYHTATGKTLKDGTLGVIIRECKKVNVESKITVLAEQIKKFGDDRAHSNLERKDPVMANLGGDSRAVEVLTPSKHLIHPYKGNAKQAILDTRDLLFSAFG
jgi:hypothetical protein